MIIAIGSDHRGFKLKEKVKAYLKKNGHEIIDCGTNSSESVDYPVFSQRVALSLIKEKADKGILICSSGMGVCIAVNKFKGIRGTTVRDSEDAKIAVSHNNSNVLCIGADHTNLQKTKKIIAAYLNTEFEGGRHQRRLDLISEFEMKDK